VGALTGFTLSGVPVPSRDVELVLALLKLPEPGDSSCALPGSTDFGSARPRSVETLLSSVFAGCLVEDFLLEKSFGSFGCFSDLPCGESTFLPSIAYLSSGWLINLKIQDCQLCKNYDFLKSFD
jgi:hypothetical protein